MVFFDVLAILIASARGIMSLCVMGGVDFY